MVRSGSRRINNVKRVFADSGRCVCERSGISAILCACVAVAAARGSVAAAGAARDRRAHGRLPSGPSTRSLTMPPRRISAENARETLVTKFARAEASAGMDAATPVDDSDPAAAKQAREEHLKLVREAGRAALEESLLSSGVKRKASEMTPAGIAAQWQAYAEVYGTNGMAAGGGRSSLVRAQDEAADESAVASSQPRVSTPRRGRRGGSGAGRG